MKQNQGSILVIDDEKAIRSLLTRRLLSDGYQCLEAGNAQEAAALLKNDAVDLVILDIKMPGKSGTELLPEIKTNYPDTAVIMATATTDTNIAVQCMKQGAYDYLTKPFNLDEVSLSVARATERRRLEIENRKYQQHLEGMVAEQAKKIRNSFLNSIASLVYALEAKDKYTSGHSQRVADISAAVAREMSISQTSIDRVRLAGLVHDIGKMGIRESILNKSNGLTREESLSIQTHPGIGERILAPVIDEEEVLKAVRNHHESYDGSGYPDGLKGTGIPLPAKILAVSDSYEAMTSERPYRKAMSKEDACREIENGSGKQFDPKVVAAFLRTIARSRVHATQSS
jgi:putative nucleotidyltransferase with HDIG domain